MKQTDYYKINEVSKLISYFESFQTILSKESCIFKRNINENSVSMIIIYFKLAKYTIDFPNKNISEIYYRFDSLMNKLNKIFVKSYLNAKYGKETIKS